MHYKCSRCGHSQDRENLTVKKAVFMEMGEGANTIRSRVIDRLCPDCLSEDADWNRNSLTMKREKING